MTLYEACKNREYTVEGLFVEAAVTRRLQALGLNDGTRIRILNRKSGGADHPGAGYQIGSGQASLLQY